MTQPPQRWGKVGNAKRFPSGPRPRLFHNQTIPLALDKTDSRSTSLRSGRDDNLVFGKGADTQEKLAYR